MDRIPESARMDAAEEELLVRSAVGGDRAAFLALARLHLQPVYRIVFALIRDRDQARQLAIDTFLRGWRGMRHMPTDQSFAVRIGRIARNLALAHQRRLFTGSPPATPAAGPAAGADDFTLEQCEEAFASITPEYQHVLVLRLLERQTYAEIASTLDLPPAITISRVSGARQAMLERLGAASGPPAP